MKTIYLHPFIDLFISVLILSLAKSQDFGGNVPPIDKDFTNQMNESEGITPDIKVPLEEQPSGGTAFSVNDDLREKSPKSSSEYDLPIGTTNSTENNNIESKADLSTNIKSSSEIVSEENGSHQTVGTTDQQMSQFPETDDNNSFTDIPMTSTSKDESEYEWWPIFLLVIVFTICAILGTLWAIIRYSTIKSKETEGEEKRISASDSAKPEEPVPPLLPPPPPPPPPPVTIKKPVPHTSSEELDELSISLTESEPKIQLKVPSDSDLTTTPSITSQESLDEERSSLPNQ